VPLARAATLTAATQLQAAQVAMLLAALVVTAALRSAVTADLAE